MEQDINKNNKKNTKKVSKRVVIIVLILIALLAALISMEYGKTVTNGKIPESQTKSIKDFPCDASSKADFAVWNENIFYCTKDGMQYINQEGNSLWNDTFNMTLPYIVQTKGTVGVSEYGGRTLIIYNEKGKLYSAQTNEPIVSFNVSATGYSSVISSAENNYALNVFNDKGENIFAGSFQILQGMPVCTSISDDNKILAIGFVDISGIKIKSRFSFYELNKNITAPDESNDSFFASFDEDGATCGVIKFIDNNSAVSISDKYMTFMTLNPTEETKYVENKKIELKNQIKQIAFASDTSVFAAYGDKFINAENALESGTVECYDKQGNTKFQINAQRKVTGIYPNAESVLVGFDRKYICYNMKGEFQWEYTATADTKKMLIINNDENIILFVGANQASILQLSDDVLESEYKENVEVKTEAVSEEEYRPVQVETEAIKETTTLSKADNGNNTQNSENVNVENANTNTNANSNSNANKENKSNKNNSQSEQTNKSNSSEKQTEKTTVSTEKTTTDESKKQTDNAVSKDTANGTNQNAANSSQANENKNAAANNSTATDNGAATKPTNANNSANSAPAEPEQLALPEQ